MIREFSLWRAPFDRPVPSWTVPPDSSLNYRHASGEWTNQRPTKNTICMRRTRTAGEDQRCIQPMPCILLELHFWCAPSIFFLRPSCLPSFLPRGASSFRSQFANRLCAYADRDHCIMINSWPSFFSWPEGARAWLPVDKLLSLCILTAEFIETRWSMLIPPREAHFSIQQTKLLHVQVADRLSRSRWTIFK